MTNPQYQKGRRYEYKMRKFLIEEGYPIVIRASGSHGVFDLVGIDSKSKRILLVQCKTGTSANKVKRTLDYLEFNGIYRVEAVAL